ncbi:YraN family protein [Selenihalanaerobacter shriftii]|uniref:UPF0102 protein SAMN02745118_01398 n=1 Tax=Selenihalanaerobacter shriftii TaxID=142842 RepID=A0A1T4MAE2_9FIRM|nr:YraN family protein [Selenihalanaerobacter shriftii]SJZ63748.1 putative endonuclease [Selenihalanaerobacter shriftii]
MMLSKQELGRLGEKLASKYLLKKEYQIIEQNYRCRLGEIDIIAYKDNYFIFVEVKAKQNQNFGLPQEEVDFRKQQKIQQVARYYISQNPDLNVDFRFDVIAILYQGDDDYQLSHLRNAFSVV